MDSAPFLSNILSVTQVCRRWKKVVRSSDTLWRPVCNWRLRWAQKHGLLEILGLVDPPRLRRAIVGAEGGESKWLGLCLKYDTSLSEMGWGERSNRDDYVSRGTT